MGVWWARLGRAGRWWGWSVLARGVGTRTTQGSTQGQNCVGESNKLEVDIVVDVVVRVRVHLLICKEIIMIAAVVDKNFSVVY